MSDAQQELRSLYQAVNAEKRGVTLDLVDNLAEAVMLYIKADFCALFIGSDGEGLMPVSLCHLPEIQLDYLQLLRLRWGRELSPAVERGENLTDDESGQQLENDEFAERNGFFASGSYRYQDHRGREVLIVAYWREDKERQEMAGVQLLEQMSRLVVTSLDSFDINGAVDDLAENLAELVALFELNHTEVSFADAISQVLDTASVVLPVKASGLLVRKGRTEPFEEFRVERNSAVGETLGSEVIALVSDRFSRVPAPDKTGWIELTDEGQSRAIVAGLVLVEPNLEYALVLVREAPDRMDAVGAQLLSLYMHSARSVIGHARSVQKLRRSHRALQKSSDKMAAMEALAAVSDMTSGVAHEFNNIIGGIVGRIQLMKMKTDDDKLFNDLEKIERLALGGAETVKHIQEFATRSRYKKPEPVDLVALVRTSLTNSQADWYALADSKQLSIVTRFPEFGAAIDGSGPDLISALDHMVENAVEHAPDGSQIIVSLDAKSDRYRLSVRDSGPGVEEGLRSKVFYPFFSTKKERGAGLGLSIVYGTAVRHGGRVGYEDAPGGGAIFFMEMEFAKGDDPTETTGQIEQNRGVLNILVVDDDRLIREILCDMLTIDGHQTVACEDGFRALEAIEKQSFDLVITDLGMPGMSGLDLAGTIHQSHPKLPIAMITGWGTQLSHDEIKSKGIKTLLSKPFHLKDIKNIVADLVTGDRQPA